MWCETCKAGKGDSVPSNDMLLKYAREKEKGMKAKEAKEEKDDGRRMEHDPDILVQCPKCDLWASGGIQGHCSGCGQSLASVWATAYENQMVDFTPSYNKAVLIGREDCSVKWGKSLSAMKARQMTWHDIAREEAIAKPESDQWECPSCTVHNSDAMPKCAVCDASHP